MASFGRINELASRQGTILMRVALNLKYGENYFYSLKTGK